MTYAEKLEKAGVEIINCKTQKEFLHEMRNYTNYHGDACIDIWYTDGTSCSYYPALGINGKFKKTGIKSAIIANGYGYTVYNYDLCEEWEDCRVALTEEEETAIENGICLENFRITKALQQEQEQEQPTEYTEKGAEEEIEVFPNPGEVQEPEQEQAQEQEQTEEIPFIPSDFLSKPEFKIDILGALKKAGYNTGYIRKHKIFPESTVQKFRSGNADISINTLFRVCQILNKDISDVIKFKIGEEQEPEQEQEQEHPTEYTKKGAEDETEVFPKPGEEQEPEQEQEQEQEHPTEYTKKGAEDETEVFPKPGEEQEPEQEQEQEDPFKNIKINIEIEKLDLFIRTYNILKRAGVNTTADLKKIDKRNLGKRTIAEVENALQKLKE